MMRLGLGQFNFSGWGNYGYAQHRKKRTQPVDPCARVCSGSGSDVACAACQARGDLNFSPVSMYGAPMGYYPPQQPQALGQSVTDSPAGMFVIGALTWAFFGPVIKGAIGLSSSVAGYGIEKAHGKLNKVRAGGSPGRKRLPPPSGSDDDED